MGSLEGAYSLAYGSSALLSEQNIIDCSGATTHYYVFHYEMISTRWRSGLVHLIPTHPLKILTHKAHTIMV